MEIIGKTNGGFILSASEKEVAHLMGKNSEYRLASGEIAIGTAFRINDCWDRLDRLNSNRYSLKKVGGQLRAMADLLEPISMIPDTLGGSESDGM